MQDILQGSNAYPLLFFMTDSADSKTGKTGLSPTVTISKNGGSFGSPSGSVTEIANGWYKVAGNATDTDTLGQIALHATGSGADDCDMLVGQVVSFNPRDAAALGLSRIDAAVTTRMATFTLPTNFSSFSIDGSGRVDVIKINGTSQTARDLGASVLLSSGTGTGQVSLASGAVTVGTLSTGALDSIYNYVVDGTRTFVQLMRGFTAVLLGKCSGGGTSTITFRNIADSKDVVVATEDSFGNRSAITRDLT